MREALRRAFEAIDGGGALGYALRKAEAAVEAVLGDPVREGPPDSGTPSQLSQAQDREIAELLELLADHAVTTGIELPQHLAGIPGFSPRGVADWFRVVSAHARSVLGWPLVDWPTTERTTSWQSELTVQAAADRAEREIRPGRPIAKLAAEANRLMETVCAWLDPRETTPRLDVFFALHCDVCGLELECDEEQFPFAALGAYIESIREYIHD